MANEHDDYWTKRRQEEAEYASFLESIKPDDDVLITSYGFGGEKNMILRRVTRVTKAQIIFEISDGYIRRFHKKDGREVGGGSSWRAANQLEPNNEKNRLIAERQKLTSQVLNLMSSVKDVHRDKIRGRSIEQLEELKQALERLVSSLA